MMSFNTRGVSVLAACIATLAGGCANMSGLDGTTEYACKAPQGVQCDSVSGNYYNSLQNNLPSQRQSPATDGDLAKARSSRGRPSDERAVRPPSSAHAPSDEPSPATAVALPLRSQGQILRLWFKPWEDADRDLHDQGYVYVQIDNGRWLIDHAQQRIRDAYAPIRPPRAAAASPAASAQSTIPISKTSDTGLRARPAENALTMPRTAGGAPNKPAIDLP